jgi:hypothetical protein
LPKRGSKVDEHLPSAGHVKKTQINSQHQEFGPKVSKGTGRRRAGAAGIGDPLSIGWTPPLATAAGLARLMQANGA